MPNLYAPEAGEGSGGGAGSQAGAPAGGALPNAGAGSPGGGTLLAGSPNSSAGGAGTPPAGGAGGGTQAGTGTQGGTGAPVIQKSWREGWIGSDGKIDKTAYDRLPDHLKPFSDTLKKYDTDEALLGAFLHSQTLNGKKGLQPLPPGASDKDKAEWSSRLNELLGVPKDPSGYGVLEKPKDLPDALWNGEYVQTMAGIMHKHGASPALVKELFAADAKYGNGKMSASQTEVTQARAAAEQEINIAFGPARDAEITAAKRAAETVGIDINDPVLGNNPKVIIALAKVAKLLGEDKLVKGGSDIAGAGAGDDRARARDIVMNKSNALHEAYHDPKHGGHAQAVAQYEALVANWIRRNGGKAA